MKSASAAVEDEVDRIDGDDRGEQRRAGLAAGDQVARIDAPVRDAAGDRRAHLGPFQIELRHLQGGFGRFHRRHGVALRRSAGFRIRAR